MHSQKAQNPQGMGASSDRARRSDPGSLLPPPSHHDGTSSIVGLFCDIPWSAPAKASGRTIDCNTVSDHGVTSLKNPVKQAQRRIRRMVCKLTKHIQAGLCKDIANFHKRLATPIHSLAPTGGFSQQELVHSWDVRFTPPLYDSLLFAGQQSYQQCPVILDGMILAFWESLSPPGRTSGLFCLSIQK